MKKIILMWTAVIALSIVAIYIVSNYKNSSDLSFVTDTPVISPTSETNTPENTSEPTKNQPSMTKEQEVKESPTLVPKNTPIPKDTTIKPTENHTPPPTNTPSSTTLQNTPTPTSAPANTPSPTPQNTPTPTNTPTNTPSPTPTNTPTPTIDPKLLAPDFTLYDIDGNEVSLSDFRGKKVFLNFWATWCPPCKEEMPDMQLFHKQEEENDIVVIAVNIGESKSKVKDFIDSKGYEFLTLLDSKKEIAKLYNVNAIPTTFFINSQGVKIKSKIGGMELEDMEYYMDMID